MGYTHTVPRQITMRSYQPTSLLQEGRWSKQLWNCLTFKETKRQQPISLNLAPGESKLAELLELVYAI
jgi:hypothetical protein